MTKSIIALFATVSMCQLAQAQDPKGNLIRLVDALDEPEFYCFDIAGFGKYLQLNDPLQAHTCKSFERGTDQKFYFEGQQLKIEGYDRCVQAAGSSDTTLAGSAVLARECSDANLQKFSMDDAGKIRLGDGTFCLAAGADSGEASGPSHVWRTLSVVKCEGADNSLTTWQIGNE